MSRIGCYLCFGALEVLDLDFYFDLNACGKLYAHESINYLLGRLDDINESLVSAHLELLTAILVLVYRTKDGNNFLICRKGSLISPISLKTPLITSELTLPMNKAQTMAKKSFLVLKLKKQRELLTDMNGLTSDCHLA